MPNKETIQKNIVSHIQEKKPEPAFAIAVDFDGCLCINKWPEIGAPCMGTIYKLKRAKARGAKIILDTCREGQLLEDALRWCRSHGIEFDAVNDNLPERIALTGNNPRKIGADEYWSARSIFTMPSEQMGGPNGIKDNAVKIECVIINPETKKQHTVMGLIDTGAATSAISEKLANELELKEISSGEQVSAGGLYVSKIFNIDIRFPLIINSRQRYNVDVSSFISTGNTQVDGFIVGLDFLSRWYIVWDGESSTVYIRLPRSY